VLLALVATVGGAAASPPVHQLAVALIAAAARLVEQHVVAGAIVYVLLSALSAMVVFFSTALLTPVAVQAFGPLHALLLLWLGWVLGGVISYGIGRLLGQRVAAWFLPADRLHEYADRARRLVTFRHVLLFQLAVPSEIPGYVLGLSGCRFVRFFAGMALGELPFAAGAVYLGESFLRRSYPMLIAVGVAGVALSWLTFRYLHAQWSAAAAPPGATE
jgi:uncharacterized membrane protein YdjX (TVP38/TMEM64 family)